MIDFHRKGNTSGLSAPDAQRVLLQDASANALKHAAGYALDHSSF